MIRLSGAVMRVDTMALDDDDVFWGRGPDAEDGSDGARDDAPCTGRGGLPGRRRVASPVSVASAESVVSSPSSLLSSGCWPPPEMHCEYQSLPKLQILPVAQAVGPFQLRPPPGGYVRCQQTYIYISMSVSTSRHFFSPPSVSYIVPIGSASGATSSAPKLPATKRAAAVRSCANILRPVLRDL